MLHILRYNAKMLALSHFLSKKVRRIISDTSYHRARWVCRTHMIGRFIHSSILATSFALHSVVTSVTGTRHSIQRAECVCVCVTVHAPRSNTYTHARNVNVKENEITNIHRDQRDVRYDFFFVFSFLFFFQSFDCILRPLKCKSLG